MMSVLRDACTVVRYVGRNMNHGEKLKDVPVQKEDEVVI